jgi:hypothetical protein
MLVFFTRSCRDAYRKALPFYEKNDFRYLTTKDLDDDTRAMYFDLKAI